MTNNLFGTDGIRNTVGIKPLTMVNIPRLGHAIARWALKKHDAPLSILLAHDSRASGEWMSSALASGLLLCPIAIQYAQVLPTPAVCNLLQQQKDIHVGIIISASHNPYQDNGIKIVTSKTGKISTQDEEIISALYQHSQKSTYCSFGSMQYYHTAQEEYIQSIVGRFSHGLLTGKKVVLDCANGATSYIAPEIFCQLGAKTIVIHNSPNGTNINEQSGALHVEKLTKIVLKEEADIGFAFDGDGDRVVAITKNGTTKNGDDLIALLSGHPIYQNETHIVGTVMSNHGLDLFLRNNNKQLIRTQVGDKYVADYLQQHKMLLGGEQSGHIILNDYLPTADSMVTALRVLEIIAQTDNWNMHTFARYPQILVNVPVSYKKSLSTPNITAIISDHETKLQAGRLVVRYSGTENVLRVMVEDQEQKTAHHIGTSLAHTLQKELLQL